MERRHRRSSDPCQALVYQFEASRERANLDAMVLADDQGLCIASSGDPEVCEEIAAHMAILGHTVPRFRGVFLTEQKLRWTMHMRRFSVAGAELCLCAVGGATERRAEELVQSVGGTARILAA